MPGMPIVFIPGLMTTCRIYQHEIEDLGQRHPVLLANHWSAPTMREIATQILAVAPERFALAGTSMGGYAALEIIRQAPNRVTSLALLSTSAKPDTPEKSKGRREQVAAARKAGNMRAGTKALFPKLVHPARHEDHPLLTTFIEMAEHLGVDAFDRQIEAIISREDARSLLSTIKIPTLVVVGKDDTLIPPDEGREIAAGIDGAKIEEIENAGHMCMIERPEAVTSALVKFFG
ncbi:MAG: alpha/beta fold hydrolase [Alphaproteobacteria bacterium]|jgi:pimeloyl-ACP methyl ester carboxylesterase|nr:MAG: alpha/beta fold hydrolase [Alphaproteobacteria bacterium]